LIDDGAMILRVVSSAINNVVCEVVSGGVLTSRKGVSVPGCKIAVSSLTPKDRIDLAFAIQQQVDAVALSFVRSADDIRELRALIRVLSPDVKQEPIVVAKIEKPEAVHDLKDILNVTDVVMVARGDLGVESSPEEVPFYQKEIIHACLAHGTPVITATQMLQSMVHSPSPTRAEASDVANAVLDGSDAVMLSAETASGEHPIEAVQVMQSIAARAERAMAAQNGHAFHWQHDDDLSNAITHAAVELAQDIRASALVCLTHSGYTARMIARHRPNIPIIAFADTERAHRSTAFMWGVRSILMDHMSGAEEMFDVAAKMIAQRGWAKIGDRIVIVAGVPLGSGTGATNLIRAHVV